MIDELFPNKGDREAAKESLKTLIDSKGWNILKKMLDFDLKKLDNRLKFESFEKIEDQRRCQEKYAELLLLKSYPEEMIGALSDKPTEKVELDPFDFGGTQLPEEEEAK